MANEMRIDVGRVLEIAASLEQQNIKLREELNESKSTLNRLSNLWEGEAAQATISSFNAFSDKYFQSYEDIINQYVRFLRQNVGQGYSDTEAENTSLADDFR